MEVSPGPDGWRTGRVLGARCILRWVRQGGRRRKCVEVDTMSAGLLASPPQASADLSGLECTAVELWAGVDAPVEVLAQVGGGRESAALGDRVDRQVGGLEEALGQLDALAE